jgi:hypothetical protein
MVVALPWIHICRKNDMKLLRLLFLAMRAIPAEETRIIISDSSLFTCLTIHVHLRKPELVKKENSVKRPKKHVAALT